MNHSTESKQSNFPPFTQAIQQSQSMKDILVVPDEAEEAYWPHRRHNRRSAGHHRQSAPAGLARVKVKRCC